ncbi:tetratricopeptide (TPR) repeat protein [Variovorax boronicumulans]|uniref:helix-turn-helix domain-containing protein n=1 Tax=Variovorax boronicumulans TaxID=436515 RepID=UPI0027873EC4|nr:helix-turn-helix domain-containing protein [Variovorax boronicumulans]MDP9909407.1 tetratricopeptide (TPR) repeat protein [Variovorax boronicumulans]
MDSLIAASARALAAGDALGALKRVALRDDPPALALRGIAMAQLGEHPRARELLRRAASGFGAHEELARARCVVAEAEVALAMRDLGGSPRALTAAAATLEARDDLVNALQARLIAARRLLLLGRLDEAAAALSRLDGHSLPPLLSAVAELASAELALRSLRTAAARAALDRAHDAAWRARVPALLAEVAEARAALERPAARRIAAGGEQALRLDEVEALLASDALVVDACRRGVGGGDTWRSLARRPVLFSLARALAAAWPGDVDRDALIADAFRTRDPDETHRARLRVEIGRLRALVKPMARIEATPQGFILQPLDARPVVVLAPPIDGEQASLVALLSDGAAWSTSALALALGASQRTVQRALAELEAERRVRAIGQARARRWLAPPLAGFTTILLLPAALPIE